MWRNRTYLCWLVAWLGATSLALATADMEHRFGSIKERNMFGIKPPPPPPEPPPTPPPPTTVKITGVMNLLGNKRAILQIQEQGKQPESKVMREGDQQGAVELKEIDVENGVVKILNTGREQSLSLSKDGLSVPTGPAPAAPGAPTMATPTPQMPTPVAAAPNFTSFPGIAATPMPGFNPSSFAGPGISVTGPGAGAVASPVQGMSFKFGEANTGTYVVRELPQEKLSAEEQFTLHALQFPNGKLQIKNKTYIEPPFPVPPSLEKQLNQQQPQQNP